MTNKDMNYKQHETDLLKEFVEWLKDRFESRIDMARDQYFYSLNLHNTLDCCLWSREQNVLQRTHDFLDNDLENFIHERHNDMLEKFLEEKNNDK